MLFHYIDNLALYLYKFLKIFEYTFSPGLLQQMIYLYQMILVDVTVVYHEDF